MKKGLISILTFLSIGVLCSQNYWNQITKSELSIDGQIEASHASYFVLDYTSFSNALFQAPERIEKNQISSTIVALPMPDGSMEEFMVFESSIMEEGLQEKYPNLRTFVVQSTENIETTGRVDLTHKGFHAMLFFTEGTIYIDPFSQAENKTHISYFKKDFISNKPLPSCLSQETSSILEDEHLEQENELDLHKNMKSSNGGTLRTYRIAVSATGEFTQYHGGTVVDGLAAVVTTINRVNGVYEREVTVRLVLVANNDQIIYTNANSDPFTNPNNAGQLLSQNQNSVDNVIGSNNYDVGHVVGRSGSGLASFGVVCGNNKAQGTTGINNPIGDPFDIDYVSHEIGHQFAGSHTFNGDGGSCGGNRSGNSAYEPGSGSTIMSYAGICAPQNTANNSSDYFHARTFDQMLTFTTQFFGNNCPVKTQTGNSIPQVQIISSVGLTIPKSTPFELEATGSDVDGDIITFCWEQYDLGPAGAPNSPSGNAPLFRSFPPSIEGTRVFPQISDIVNNTQTIGEILPDYGRDMRFRVTLRDNVIGGGAVNNDDLTLSVTNNAGPFLVTYPNSSLTWTAGDTYTVTWDVANTTSSPVNCSNVDIYLSTDGGYTYSILLASAVANDGSQDVVAPFALTNEARIKVKAANNVFFDISNQDFEIVGDCNSVDPSIDVLPLDGATWCLNSLGQLYVEATSTDLAITSHQWFFNNSPIAGATSATLTIQNVQLSDGGDYFCRIENGCNTVNSTSATVFVTQNPILPVITQVGSQLQSSLTTGNQWYLDGNILLGENRQFITPTESGAYTVKSVAGSCSASSGVINFSVGIQDLNAVASITILPNPSEGIFKITTGEYQEELSISVKNVLGQEVLPSKTFNSNTTIDLSSVSNGMYLVMLSSKSHQATYKIVKK